MLSRNLSGQGQNSCYAVGQVNGRFSSNLVRPLCAHLPEAPSFVMYPEEDLQRSAL